MKTPLPKGFDHADVDPKWYAFWESIGAFRADPSSDKPRFSMVIPPPNVTGSLHMGHALNHTLPDIVARWKRMQGYDVLWLPGTDHAGIATQNVVEKQLALEGKTRHDLGREAFEARVWEWVRQSHGTITGQMRKLGESVDWSRERFTLDEMLSRAVRRVFVSLYQDGLIYRGTYIVNWCPRCRTALSDLEVVHQPKAAQLWYVRYPGTKGGRGVTVATTRPETMLGDTAIAVNPGDERYRDLVGGHVILPIIGRELPVIADEFVDPAFGTGAVKVTPAHDPNDFQMGQRHGLPQVAVIDEDARITAAGGPYAGQDRFAAREGIVAQLEREGLLEKIEPHEHAVGTCQRCGTVVEPLVSTQWFVKVAPLAKEAIRVVEQGKIRFFPETWTKTYYDWMYNIHDWCISRQLWWGHRIPAWYCEACGEMIVSEQAPERCPCGGTLRQDPDVLDTWFSSQLWPFSTMGWPDRTGDLARYYPTDLMLTAFDIIFFWVARMIMAGVRFAGDIPFREVYITGLVRDEGGRKMSKSKGNVVDPLEVMDEIGADALRFTLTAMAAPGMDIPLSEGRMQGYRQFINKIWNASRFVLMNAGELEERPEIPAGAPLALIHRWILHRLNVVTGEVQESLETFRFDVAADRLYHFFWDEYADWYIEMVKPHLQAGGDEGRIAQAVLLEVHDRTLRLLHPIIPFVTEELWQHLPRRAGDGPTVTLAAWPKVRPEWVDEAADAEVGLLQGVVTTIRTARAEGKVKPSAKVGVTLEGAGEEQVRILRAQQRYLTTLAGLSSFEFGAEAPGGEDLVTRVLGDLRVHIQLPHRDRGAEVEKLRKQLADKLREVAGVDAKLANEEFVAKAPARVVEGARAQRDKLLVEQRRIEETLRELGEP
ncbi:MAG TPA: valine--tRNA ligase [Vicinamibacterales bacterium]|nr:valine--tRNA ligase [Vicinamibacterales bacterium]